MAYIAPIHRPSSIRHALKLRLLTPDEECLVVAKANRLEIFLQTDDGLSFHRAEPCYGNVTMLSKITPSQTSPDLLFVGTDRHTYFALSWNAGLKRLKTVKSYLDVADRAARDSQTGDRCLIDPTGQLMTLEIYEGIVTVIPLTERNKKKAIPDANKMGEPVPSRIEEMFVRSSTFLHRKSPETEKPLMALLYEDDEETKIRLRLRQVNFTPAAASDDTGSPDLEIIEGTKDELDLGAGHLIPVPGPHYGTLILGETSITYFNDYTKSLVKRPLEESTIFVAWEQIDSQRFLLADEFGILSLLMLLFDESGTVDGWKLEKLGETSRASVLVYLDAGHLFVGSHEGDSQVIKLAEKSIEIVQTFPNIAPILDFTIMDMGNRSGEGQGNEYSSGQARIVTGSGAFKDGSLRSVRSGVGLEDHGSIGEIGSISNIFSLKSSQGIDFDDILLVSLLDETRVFSFDSTGQVEELEEFKGLVLLESTLLARNLPGDRLLQVSSSAARITDRESSMIVSEWNAPTGRTITDVAANDTFLVVSVGGGQVIVLSTADSLKTHAEKDFGADNQIACVALPQSPDKVCIVGFWQSCTVSIISLDGLKQIQSAQLSDNGSSVPRSLLITQIFDGPQPTLFVATGDGNVVTFSVDPNTYALSNKKSTILGTQQANFRALPRGDGLYNVFATCEHPSLIYGSEGRLVYSAVTAEKATSVCPFNAEAYPGAVAIASSGELHIALVDSERTTHVQTLHVNETVRRIAYSPALKAFGLGTIKRTIRDHEEVVQGHFKLVDEVVFKELHTFDMNEYEIVESVMRAELSDGSGEVAERFVVGTAFLNEEDDKESLRGRILVFEVTEDRQLKLIAELSVKGACRCLAMVEGKIVAALIKTVVVYSFEFHTGSTPQLTKKAAFRTSTAPIDVVVSGKIIAIADLMKSVSIVEYHPGDGERNDRLTEVARHLQVSWSTALVEVKENTYLQADAEGNLTLLERDVSGVTVEDQRRLVPRGDMLLGEQVNRMRRVDVAIATDAPVIPKAFLATVEGSIYLFALISPSKIDLLLRLQAMLAEFLHEEELIPGYSKEYGTRGAPFNEYRAFRNQVRAEDEPNRFVDGDLIEQFLNLDADDQDEIVQRLRYKDVDVDSVRTMVETLKRLH
ncbi:DNA damage-binding protein 1 [Phyllosticta citriasiana]|uniref:DNA damage-binding protein 1 n=1 Tax=Phyllosticta citriasiana TaxID=595635 RepID=UPI0030FD61D1